MRGYFIYCYAPIIPHHGWHRHHYQMYPTWLWIFHKTNVVLNLVIYKRFSVRMHHQTIALSFLDEFQWVCYFNYTHTKKKKLIRCWCMLLVVLTLLHYCDVPAWCCHLSANVQITQITVANSQRKLCAVPNFSA